jgi:PhzF family phenazine biosynthesis protein
MVMGQVRRVSAFAKDGVGGNPAGVALLDGPAEAAEMLKAAAEIGYSETAFSYKSGDRWHTRYFAPEQEVPFCGHATIALGATLGAVNGAGLYRLALNNGDITVEASVDARGIWSSVLQSPPTWSKVMEPDLLDTLLAAFGWSQADLDPRIPPHVAHAGATHAVLALRDRAVLRDMAYDFDPMRELMLAEGLVTVALVWIESETRFHVRNPFAFGGVYEDPATGAAAAAFGGLLRDIAWPSVTGGGAFEIIQGEDMGVPSRLTIEVTPEIGASIRVAGATRPIVV